MPTTTTTTDQLITDLRARRKALGLSQRALAEQCGCDPMTISYIERGERWPRRELMSRIADALGVQVRAAPATRPATRKR